MGFERSDEARRKDALYDQIGRAERRAEKAEDKVAELESIIVDHDKRMVIAKEGIKAIKDKITKLQINTDNDLEQIRDDLKLIKIQV